MVNTRTASWWAPVLCGARGVSWQAFALIVATNTGVAAILSIEDTRPFWHPFVTAQSFGLSIAYAVNAAQPWGKSRPVWRLILAVAIGTAVGFVPLSAIKGYAFADIASHPNQFGWTAMSAFCTGLFVSLFFLVKFREARAHARILQADSDRNLLSKQAIEAQLKLMQAQIEPHFLFNTLASVQFLIETDPPQAGKMLGHLLAYLRAALPQLRSDSATLGQEIELAQAYLSVMQMRMGLRLAFAIELPAALRPHPFPPMLLMSVVENAIKHGLEPQATGGMVRLEARRSGDRLAVAVVDDGKGLANTIREGVGLGNLRERLRALYADRARFTLEEVAPHGARATIEIPYDAESAL